MAGPKTEQEARGSYPACSGAQGAELRSHPPGLPRAPRPQFKPLWDGKKWEESTAASLASPQRPSQPCPGRRGGHRGGSTSDGGPPRLVAGQPLRVALAVLAQVEAVGVDGRAGGRERQAAPAPAWGSQPHTPTQPGPRTHPADLIWLQKPSVL